VTRKPTKPRSLPPAEPVKAGPLSSGLKGLAALKGKVKVVPRTPVSVPPSPPTASKKSRSANLSDDEQDVWDYVSDTVTPIDVKQHVPMFDHLSDQSGQPTQGPTPERRVPKSPPPSRVEPVRIPRPAPTQTVTPELGDFEPRKAKRIGRGHIDIEARIDLHGDRQDEAHGRLRAFLLQCFHDGRRMVLVITGKGRETESASASDVFDIGYERREKGVLRRNVPRWLAEPDLRAIVVSYTTAHIRHGGEGALYVQLRRRR
jgi:DNA-nicking Smr family endonuclease